MKQPAFYIKKSLNGVFFYFVLQATNGKVIAISEMYNSLQACKKGIRAVKWNAPIACTKFNSL